MAAGEELAALADGFVSRRSAGLICCAVAARGDDRSGAGRR